MTEKRLFRWGDLLVVMCALLLAGLFVVAQLRATTGTYVTVQTPDGEQTLSLSQDTERVFVGRDGLSVMVCIEQGYVYVRCADCPDQVCVHTGKICDGGRSIACLPAGVVVTVVSDDSDAPDAVAR